jgi:hypothetical protein
VLEHPALTLGAGCFINPLTGVHVEGRGRSKRMIRPLVEVPGVSGQRVVAFGAELIVSHGRILPPAQYAQRGSGYGPPCDDLSRGSPRHHPADVEFWYGTMLGMATTNRKHIKIAKQARTIVRVGKNSNRLHIDVTLTPKQEANLLKMLSERAKK